MVKHLQSPSAKPKSSIHSPGAGLDALLTCQGHHEALQLAQALPKDEEAADVVGEADGAAAERHQQVGHGQVHQDVIEGRAQPLVPDGHHDHQAIEHRGRGHHQPHEHGHPQVHGPGGLVGPLGTIKGPWGAAVWGLLGAVHGAAAPGAGELPQKQSLFIELEGLTCPRAAWLSNTLSFILI